MNKKRPKAILATDLDGTLIPLDQHPENIKDLQRLQELLNHHQAEVIFVTGRHLDSVRQAISDFHLPKTDWIICDVGTSIFCRTPSGQFEAVAQYSDHLRTIVNQLPYKILKSKVESHGMLRLQEPVKQSEFKLSFYTDQSQLSSLATTLNQQLEDWDAPWSIIASVDPFNGDGLIDFLPKSVSKAYALRWWAGHTETEIESIVFAGDSGNDLAALTAGYHSIVVANADRQIAELAASAHQKANWRDRLFLATRPATSGLLEGCQEFWNRSTS